MTVRAQWRGGVVCAAEVAETGHTVVGDGPEQRTPRITRLRRRIGVVTEIEHR